MAEGGFPSCAARAVQGVADTTATMTRAWMDSHGACSFVERGMNWDSASKADCVSGSKQRDCLSAGQCVQCWLYCYHQNIGLEPRFDHQGISSLCSLFNRDEMNRNIDQLARLGVGEDGALEKKCPQ